MKKSNLSNSVGSTSAQISATGVLVIPDGTKTIKQYEYRGNESIKTVEIPNSVTKISRGAFEDCSRLRRIKGGDGLKEISIRAFKGTALKEIVLPKSLQRLREHAFEDCDYLESVDFDNDNTIVEAGCFKFCSALNTVLLPMKMDEIPDELFWACYNLENVALSPNLRTIGNCSFVWCRQLKQFGYYSFAKYQGFVIPNTVTKVGDGAFWGCMGMTNITIPNSITEIGNDSFTYCSCLTKVDIPDSVTCIGDRAFMHCKEMSTAYIGNAVTSIGMKAFANNEMLTEVTFTSAVITSIYADAFADCHNLKRINVPACAIGTYKRLLPKHLHKMLVGY